MQKLLRHPLLVLRNRYRHVVELIRFRRPGGYRERAYWSYRHRLYGLDLRGVGDRNRSHEENCRLLSQGGMLLVELCQESGIRFDAARVLDVGCGTGYFAGVLNARGVRSYRGIDIVDTLFDKLRTALPGYNFSVHDISRQPIEGTYDLILAMDVLQHIVDDERFASAIRHMQACLAPGGAIIISTYIGEYLQEGFYVVRRPHHHLDSQFRGFVRSVSRSYADSLIFSYRRSPGTVQSIDVT